MQKFIKNLKAFVCGAQSPTTRVFLLPNFFAMQDITCQHCGNINAYRTIMKGNQLTAWCNGCDKFIKNIPQGKPPQIFFGKYKDRYLSTLTSKEEVEYLQWVAQQTWCKNLLRGQIEDHIKSL